MSFTAFKAMLLFSYLLEAPRSYEEIREYFANHEFLHETISIDTLRVYINSLERLGCEIVRGKKIDGSKYKLVKHPFELSIPDVQAKSIIKVFKAISKSIELEDLILLTKFFKKISKSVSDEKLKNMLENISPLTKVNSDILLSLIKACRKNDEITITYNSPISGIKDIDILATKMTISGSKIYLHGKCSQYPNTAAFLVSRITKIPVTKLEKTIKDEEEAFVVGCEIYNNEIPLLDDDKVISRDDNKLVVEINCKNKFLTRQRILAMGSDCKVLYPQSFKEDIISILKKMKEEYVVEKI